jgi:uncharacterized protein YukE
MFQQHNFLLSKRCQSSSRQNPPPINPKPIIAELRNKLAEIKQQNDELERNMSYGVDEITEYCARLRNQVDLETEKVIEQAHQFNEQFKTEIAQYEKDCSESFNSQIDQFKKQINEISKKTVSFTQETEQYLDDFQVDDQRVADLLSKAYIYLQDFTVAHRSLRSLKFNKSIMEFSGCETKLDQSVLANLQTRN